MSERPIRYKEQSSWIIKEVEQTPGITKANLDNLLVLAIQRSESIPQDLVGPDFLSRREMELVRFILSTWPTDRDIASYFSISTDAVKFHLWNIRGKIQALHPSAQIESRVGFFSYLIRINL